MTILIYVLGGFFILLWVAMMGAYFMTRHLGMFLFALVYGTAGLAAILTTHWWPLVVGLILAWFLRLAGLEPSTGKQPQHSDSEHRQNS